MLGTRLGRVLRAACDLDALTITDDEATFAASVHVGTRVLACDASDLELALAAAALAPRAKLLVWSAESTLPLIAVGQQDTRVSNVVGWPSFDSMPRAWELLFALRRLLGHHHPSLRELFPWGSSHHKYQPRDTAALESTVVAIGDLAETAGAPQRTAQRLAEATHELLMNAMYDAPVDQYGEKRFAFRRDEAIELAVDEAPTVRLASDGTRLALEVSDPFGRLERDSLFGGIARGSGRDATLDTRGGGAGLGLARIFSTGFALFVDVLSGQRTTLTLVLDLDVRVREARTLPLSLHWFSS